MAARALIGQVRSRARSLGAFRTARRLTSLPACRASLSRSIAFGKLVFVVPREKLKNRTMLLSLVEVVAVLLLLPLPLLLLQWLTLLSLF